MQAAGLCKHKPRKSLNCRIRVKRFGDGMSAGTRNKQRLRPAPKGKTTTRHPKCRRPAVPRRVQLQKIMQGWPGSEKFGPMIDVGKPKSSGTLQGLRGKPRVYGGIDAHGRRP